MLISHTTLFIGFPFPILCASAKSGRLDIGFIAQPVKTRIRIKARIHERVPAILIKRSYPDCGIRLIVKFSFFFLFHVGSNLAAKPTVNCSELQMSSIDGHYPLCDSTIFWNNRFLFQSFIIRVLSISVLLKYNNIQHIYDPFNKFYHAILIFYSPIRSCKSYNLCAKSSHF